MGTLQARFERALWQSRLLVLLAVVASLVVAVVVLWVATVDVAYLLGKVSAYAGQTLSVEARDRMRAGLTSDAIKVLDTYLLAVIMLVFALGLYELFIDKIDAAEGSDLAQRLLLIHSLDDLKHRLANVVLLKLMVKYFQQALKFEYQTAHELLALAAGIALMGLALFLTQRMVGGHGAPAEGATDPTATDPGKCH